MWKIDPAIAVALSERFNVGALQHEVTRLVRSNTREILDCPEALRFLIGDKFDANIKRDIKVTSYMSTISPKEKRNIQLMSLVSVALGPNTACVGHYILRETLRQ